ncbi:SDR family NAD(P)-dependent oxidoreductase [Candidatus Woesearchaeota archaeon]|nr:SDR family NAD(P)-dependent oxidoreductase [Candidatus Woesearchaeota archaeon]
MLRKTIEVNTLAPFRLCQLFIPMMRKNKYGRIVNVSSRYGQLSTMERGDAAYRISKTPLTPEQGAETIVWAATLPDSGLTGKFFSEKKEIEW